MSALPIIKETLSSPHITYLEKVTKKLSGKKYSFQDFQELFHVTNKETIIYEKNNKQYDKLKCDIRVWNQGLGAQCSCQKLENENMCQMHLTKTKNEPWWLGLITEEKPIEPKHPKTGIHTWKQM